MNIENLNNAEEQGITADQLPPFDIMYHRREYYRLAREHAQAGRYEDAIHCCLKYSEVLDGVDKHYPYNWIAEVYDKMGDWENYVEHRMIFAGGYSDLQAAKIFREIGEECEKVEDWENAALAFKRALDCNPKTSVRKKYEKYSGKKYQPTINFTAIDFETANRDHDSACAIGLAKVEDSQIVDTKYLLINPESDFSGMHRRIHGIDSTMVKDAATFTQIWTEIEPWIHGQKVVVHNKSFDKPVLEKSLKSRNILPPRIDWMCTLRLSKKVWPGQPTYKLNHLIEYIGETVEHHHAGADAEACAKLFLVLCRDANLESLGGNGYELYCKR